MKDCVDEILRNGLIPLEAIEDILASSYASISYVMGNEAAAPFEIYVKAFMRSANAWRIFYAYLMTLLVDVFKGHLMKEFQQQREELPRQ